MLLNTSRKMEVCTLQLGNTGMCSKATVQSVLENSPGYHPPNEGHCSEGRLWSPPGPLLGLVQDQTLAVSRHQSQSFCVSPGFYEKLFQH